MLELDAVKKRFKEQFSTGENWTFTDYGKQFEVGRDETRFAVGMHCTEFGFLSIDLFDFEKKDVENFSFVWTVADFDEQFDKLTKKIEAFTSRF